MADNVVKLYPANAAKKADNVLEQAVGNFEDVLLIGWDHNGDLDARATLGLDNSKLVWLMEVFKAKLIRGDYMDDEE